MSKTRRTEDPLADYAAVLKALWPSATGFLCHDREGRLYWSHQSGQDPDLTVEYADVLQSVLTSTDPESSAVVELGELRAYILPLGGDSDHQHGTLTVLAEADPELSAADSRALLLPALQILDRELSLRFRLVDSQRKLRVQAAEEKLLHLVESLLHQRSEPDEILHRILDLCLEHLSAEGAALAIPDRDIRIIRTRAGGSGSLSRLQDKLAKALDDDAESAADCLVLPVHAANTALPGRYVLTGWKDSAFSDRRQRRVARYIVSHIESVIERDYDSLSGLMAWPLFETKLEAACAEPESDRHVLIMLDVDQLHVINENFGRITGDRILAGLGQHIRELAPEYLATRISSDSFAILMPDTDMDTARQRAEQICAKFSDHEVRAADRNFYPSASAGLTRLSNDGKGASGALANAQVACRAAKDRGRGRIEAYGDEDLSIIQRRDDIQLVGNVREAIIQDRMVLLGQPIRPLKAAVARSYFEVLVRMLNDAGEMVLPAEFFSAAERYQLMKELDQWVVTHSLQALAAAKLTAANAPIKLAINLSGQSLGDETFLPFVEEQISRSGVAPRLLCFEITESVAMANMQKAQNFMHTLKRLGCRFSLDDFGTGLSSFAYLKLFPVDTLKIDGSFVRDIATNQVSQSVVAAISEVARVMGLETVAEFVQNEASKNLLRDLGVAWGQGYLLGEPAPLSGCLASVRQRSGQSSQASH